MTASPPPQWTSALRRTPRPSSTALSLAVVWVMCFAPLAWLMSLWSPPRDVSQAALVVAGVLLPALGLWAVARAGMTGGAPLAAMAGAIVFLSDVTFRGPIGSGLDAQSAVKFGVWSLGLLLVFWRWHALRPAWGHLPSAALAVYGLWCLASTVYSATPLYTAAASVAWLGTWVVATTFAMSTAPRTGLLVITAALLLALTISLAMYALAPERALSVMDGGRSLRLSGLFGSPNNLGRAAALALLLVCLALPGLRRGPALALLTLGLAVCGACLVLSGSRTSVLGLLAGLAIAGLARRPWLAAAGAVLAVCAALLAAFAPDLRDALIAALSRSGRASEVTSFTGRTDIWAAVFGLIGQAPWLGHGFASTRELLPAAWATPFGWTTTSAHNLWLQAWVGTGAVGLLILLAAQLGWLWQVLARRAEPVRDAVTAFVLVVGLLEASAAGPSVNLLTFAWAWAAALGLGQAGQASQATGQPGQTDPSGHPRSEAQP